MGGGSWTSKAFATYTTNTRGVTLDNFVNSTSYTAQDIYKAHRLSDKLNPKNVMRECVDSEEHPNTLPVILALDVTGSMGGAAVKVAQKLNEIMTDLFADKSVPDIEFCIMGIGDLAYDEAPIQISQFESDVRIAEQLDEIYFERGGGGNTYESYTAAWYMGVNHCKLDCWNRGQKGVIITLGDECPNPYLPIKADSWRGAEGLAAVTGDKLQADVETKDLIELAKEKFNLYHIAVNDPETSYQWHNQRYGSDDKWRDLLGDGFRIATLDSLAQTVVNIVLENVNNNATEVSW